MNPPKPVMEDERRAHTQKLTQKNVAPPTQEAGESRIGIGSRRIEFDYTIHAKGGNEPDQSAPVFTQIEFSGVRWADEGLHLHLSDFRRVKNKLVVAALKHAHAHTDWPPSQIAPLLERAESGQSELTAFRGDGKE